MPHYSPSLTEQEAEDAAHAKSAARHERRAERALDKQRIEELAPKAMGGTKERQMEKRREQASANRAFAEAKASGGDMADVDESDLLGAAHDGVDGYKRQVKEMERKKNEREIRREEIMRARREEREARARDIQDREDRTMMGLIELARQRFG